MTKFSKGERVQVVESGREGRVVEPISGDRYYVFADGVLRLYYATELMPLNVRAKDSATREKPARAKDDVRETREVRRQEAAIRGFGRLTQHHYQTPKFGSASLPCKVCGLSYDAPEHKMPKAQDASHRARMHRALDAVLDGKALLDR